MAKDSFVIVGGGISGLAAGCELARHGHQVVLLEAQPRLGGRIHTVRHNGVPIELGAEFVHGRSKVLCAAIEAAGLSVLDAPARNQFYDAGQLRDVELWDKVGEVLNSVSPRRPDLPMRQFIEESSLDELTQRLALGFVEGFNAADASRISAHALLRAEYASEMMDGEAQFRIAAGYGALVDWLANSIRQAGREIITDAVVRMVRWKYAYVEALYSRNGIDESAAAERAIITLPLGVLKARTVRFDPPLAHKLQAIDDLQYGNAVRITLAFREPWWRGKHPEFVHAFDETLHTWWTDSRGHVLTGWAGGPKADSLVRASSRDLEDLAIDTISRILDKKPTSVCSLLERSYSHNWAADPWAQGAYSYIPVNGMDLPKMLAEPAAQTLFFAGEATVYDAQLGTVFGAYESGLRAAREALSS